MGSDVESAGSRRYQCSHCSQAFNRSNHLQRHERTHKPEERPFVCEVCDKAFNRKDSLLRHGRLHASDRSVGPASPISLSSTDKAAGAIPLPPPARLPSADAVLFGESFRLPGSVRSPSRPLALPPPPSDIAPSAAEPYGEAGACTPGVMPGVEHFQAWLDACTGSPGSNALWGGSLAEFMGPLDLSAMDFAAGATPFLAHSSSAGHLLPLPSERAALLSSAWPTTWQPFRSSTRSTRLPEEASDRRMDAEVTPRLLLDELRPLSRAEDDEDGDIIPHLEFVEGALQLYFARFAPALPVLHRPTFSLSSANPLLLLAVCAIGANYMATPVALRRSRLIYERLHKAILATWERRFVATRRQGILVTQAALLSQLVGMLSGIPEHALATQAFHGSCLAFARMSGMTDAAAADIDAAFLLDSVQTLTGAALDARWREWAEREVMRRAMLALSIHEVELAAFFATVPSLSRLTPPQLRACADALFDAADAIAWRDTLTHQVVSASLLSAPSYFNCIVAIAQLDGEAHILRELKVPDIVRTSVCQRYANECAHIARLPSQRAASVAVLWHLSGLNFHVDISDLEVAVGRDGMPSEAAIATATDWAATPDGRMAVLHAAGVFKHTMLLNRGIEAGLHVPRAIFHASLVLFTYLALCADVDPTQPTIDLAAELDYTRWQLIHGDCSPESLDHQAWVISGARRPVVFSGVWNTPTTRQVAVSALLSTAMSLLVSATNWPLGNALREVLAILVP